MNIRANIRAKLEREERHPIQICPHKSVEERVAYLEGRLAQLWDEVWWHQLPLWRRCFYWLLGYRSPIGKFYTEVWRGEEVDG